MGRAVRDTATAFLARAVPAADDLVAAADEIDGRCQRIEEAVLTRQALVRSTSGGFSPCCT